MSDALNVKGPDGITRSLSEHYDDQKDVEQDPCGAWLAIQSQADRIEQLETDVKAVLCREEDANRAAMKHLRALEKERIKSANYAAFSTEWRKKCEALEARVAAADKLAVILAVAMHEHDTADYGYGEENPWTMQEWFSDEDRAALAAYQATKEGK